MALLLIKTQQPDKLEEPGYKMKLIKEILRQNSGWGAMTDKWGEAMGLFFEVAAHCYERGDLNPGWGFKPGAGGNEIDTDSWYYEALNNMPYEDLYAAGDYLNRLTTALDIAGFSY